MLTSGSVNPMRVMQSGSAAGGIDAPPVGPCRDFGIDEQSNSMRMESILGDLWKVVIVTTGSGWTYATDIGIFGTYQLRF